MPWKSREDKLPPPSFFSMMVAYLQRAYPGARISRELMMTLRPFLIEAWRNGRSAEAAAQTTCSCDGRHIVPSPVVAVHVAKGSVRPPKGTQRGEVFGAESLRPPAQVERLQRKLDRVSREEQNRQTEASRWEQRAQRARTESVRHGAERRQAEVTAKRADLLAEAKRMEAELRRLQQQLNRSASPRPELAAVPPPVSPAGETPPPPLAAAGETPPSAAPRSQTKPASSTTTEREPSRRERKTRGRPRSADAPVKPAPAPGPSVESESAAMLNAIQGVLPNLAAQLAAQMAKEGAPK